MAQDTKLTMVLMDDTNQTLTLTQDNLAQGQWLIAPAKTAKPAEAVTWEAESSPDSEDEIIHGSVTYSLGNGETLTIQWNITPYGNSYQIISPEGYQCTYTGGQTPNAEVTVVMTEVPPTANR